MMPHRISPPRLANVAFAIGLCLQASVACASEPSVSESGATGAIDTVEVAAKRKPATADFGKLYRVQKMVAGILPPEPRHIDFAFRTEMKDAAAARPRLFVVGEGIDQPVPADAGGFFRLPDLAPEQAEDAALYVEARKNSGSIASKVLLRLNDKHVIPYRDFADAVREAKEVASHLPWYVRVFFLRGAKFETASFCFKDGAGGIRIGDGDYAAGLASPCIEIDFEPATAAKNPAIEFRGELAYATLEIKTSSK
jgi:hypothetical protein